MPAVALTLDVSKVSGWLNDDACCRVERRAHLTMWGEVCGTGGGSAYVGQYRRKWYARGIGPTEAGGQGVVSAPETCRTCS
eukprot:scaffold137729_cov96-Phaeocystis_antarctica.AAC.1